MTQGAEAISAYTRVLELNPNNLVALNNKALALHKQGSNGEALPFGQRAIAISPDNSEVQNTLNFIEKALN